MYNYAAAEELVSNMFDKKLFTVRALVAEMIKSEEGRENLEKALMYFFEDKETLKTLKFHPELGSKLEERLIIEFGEFGPNLSRFLRPILYSDRFNTLLEIIHDRLKLYPEFKMKSPVFRSAQFITPSRIKDVVDSPVFDGEVEVYRDTDKELTTYLGFFNRYAMRLVSTKDNTINRLIVHVEILRKIMESVEIIKSARGNNHDILRDTSRRMLDELEAELGSSVCNDVELPEKTVASIKIIRNIINDSIKRDDDFEIILISFKIIINNVSDDFN